MDKMQPISQALYSLLFLGCMGAGFPLYVQGQNVDELPPDSIYNIGYARGSLKNISGSVEQITEKQMNRELITNPLEAIQGRVPGLTILKSNNGMAALESVRLRGTTSLTSGNDPLIIVDGVLGDLTMLTSVYPTDIESFTILKDASETAQYGSRGASGVINIVTKKGRAGKTRVNYNGSFGVSHAYRRLDMLSGAEYRKLAAERGWNILDKDYTANFAVFNESSEENIFVIPMSKTLYTNQFIYLFRSRHYNHAKAYGLSGENGSSATKEVLETFGYDTPQVDARFDYCYFAGPVKDLEENQILLDDGVTPLVYEPWNVALDVSGKPYEKTAGARMKKYEVDKTGLKDGKLLDNDIVLFRYADVLLMQSEAKVRNGEDGDAELNLVRSRVGMAPRTATLENLLDERMMELAWEGWRRQDMIRFAVFTRSYSCRPQLPGEENGYTTVFPIPEKVIDMNPQLHQHKGY